MSYESRAVQNGEGNRFREEIGRYFEDFNVGDVYEHRPGRTINEADNSWFTLLTMNTHPLHFDAEYAKDSEFGKVNDKLPVWHSINLFILITLCIVTNLLLDR